MDADALQDCFDSVLAEVESQQLADASAIAQAVYADVGLLDRLRAAQGIAIVLQVSGAPQDRVAGVLSDINAESVTLQGAAGTRWVVRSSAIEVVQGLPSGHRPDSGSVVGRLGLAAALRPFAGQRVTCRAGGHCVAGLLRRVGSDHIELLVEGGTAVIAFGGIGWLRAQ